MNNGIQMVRGGQSSGLSPRTMAEAVTLAEYAAKSGLCAVKEPAQALVVLMTGMELGLSPMQSFRGIHVVNGKPVLSADLLVAIVRASGICKSWLTIESSIDRCTIETHREGDAAPVRKTWTADDAKRAGLSTQVWRAYPAQMLRHRCAADLAREVYSDLALGCYTPDEVSDGRVSDADVGTVSIVRDDAPALPPAPDALAAFRADLDAADGLTLDGAREVYARHDLGGTSLSAVTVALCGALAVRGYRLTAMEAGALLRGEMPAGLALAYDRLAAVDRHADDEDGDAVVASVVRVLRDCGALPKPAKARLLKVAAQTVATLLEVDADVAAARLDAALRPQPPQPPTGTDAPRSTSASAEGGSVAPSQSAGAQASANDGPRFVADTDSAHVQVAGTWRETEAGWSAHLAEMTVRRRVEASVGCNGALLGPRFIALAAHRIVELDAARPLPAGVARLTVIGVTQTLERIALDGSRARAAAAQGERAAA